jgi:hypothetical protein
VQLVAPALETVRVVDSAGRRVAELPPRATAWDGRTADGRRVAAGVYWLIGGRSGRRDRVVMLP